MDSELYLSIIYKELYFSLKDASQKVIYTTVFYIIRGTGVKKVFQLSCGLNRGVSLSN